jgi:phenylalanyl-tRNA synthetase beta chain
MRVSLDWLGEFVALPPEAAMVERLELGGFEDVVIEHLGPDLSAIRVGRVLERDPHPNAERLSVCRVDLGESETLAIVCGAPNVAAGQKVAVAPAGARLPDGTKLKRSKIRGVLSEGMICSSRELGLGGDHAGILVLDPDAPVGVPLPEVLPVGDRVIEVGITPNRGDSASLLGVAREVRALFGGAIRLPETAPPETGPATEDSVAVAIEAPDDCHQYAARIVRGVRVGPSPDWLRLRLEASGFRAINVVVDVTNLVLLEFGQPLHAFDLARVRGGVVRVRPAQPGEKLVTLDGQTRALDPRELVIADAERAIALAGVMGGAGTEVGEATTDVLIESAQFRPACVRATARRYGLRTDASYRFERGVDRAGVVRAADCAARLIAELAGGQVAAGALEVRGTPPAVPEPIRYEVERANRLLGTALTSDEIAALLERVGVECLEEPRGVLHCRVPSHRNDLRVHQDLTEEVARIYGYERIPTTLPEGPLAAAVEPAAWTLAERVRDALAGAGMLECASFPFVGIGDVEALRLPPDDPRRTMLTILNPINEEESQLRSALLPTLLRLVRQNRSRQVDRVRLFEVSRVFRPRPNGELPDEPLWAAAVLTAGEESSLWGTAPPLFFQAKGVAERLLFQVGYQPSLRGGPVAPYLHPGAAAVIAVGEHEVGVVGELHPEVAAAYKIDVPCAVIEVDVSALQKLPPREVRYRDVSRQPQVRRDLAVVLDRAQPAGEVLAAIRKTAGSDLVSVEPFDRYEGGGVPEGRVSLAFRLVFQKPDRTLTDAEVTRATERVVRMLTRRFKGELR